MQGDGRDEHAARDELRHELRREGPAGARHLGAPGLEREDGLVGLERPRLGDVAVADRPARGGEGSPRAARRARSARRRVVRCRRSARAARRGRRRGGRAEHPRAAAGRALGRSFAARRASCRPVAGVESQSCTRCSPRRASSAAGSVAEVLTTSRSPADRNCGSSRKRAWTSSQVVPRRDEHRDVVAAEPTRLRRFVRLQPNGELERAHAATPASSRAR